MTRPTSTNPRPRRQPLRDLARAISWHRRKLAVLAAITAVLAGVNAASPPDPPSTTVQTATSSLTGGVAVTAADLHATEVPTSLVPARAVTDPADIVGQVLSGPVPQGRVLTEVDLVSAAASPGLVLAPLRLSDAGVVALLHAGDRVDILAADPQAGDADVLAEQVRVATIPADRSGSGIGGSVASDGALILVEVDPETAKLLARASVSASLSVVLR